MLNPMSIRYPADLPITARREEIVGAIRGNQVLILAGETEADASQRDRHFILMTTVSKVVRERCLLKASTASRGIVDKSIFEVCAGY
jgi:hypothetical protein